jgi:hypothetical protein
MFVVNLSKAERIPDHVKNYVESNLPGYTFFNGRLKKFYTDFYEIDKPWFLNLDINGDNQIDWVGFLAKELDPNSYIGIFFTHDLDLYCVYSTPNGLVHSMLSEYAGMVAKDNSVSAAIYLKKPGYYQSQIDGQSDAEIPFTSIEYTDFEKSSVVYYWDGNSFKGFATSD